MRRATWAATMGLAALCACGDDAAPLQGVVQSGSRVRARYFVDDAGDRILRGWWDSQLDVDCEWQRGDDPSCMPPFLGSNMFSDAACTRPVVPAPVSSSCSGPPRYVVLWSEPCLQNTVGEVWTLTDQVAAGPSVYQRQDLTGRGCVAFPNTGEITYLQAGHPVPAGTIAAGHVRNLGSGRIQTRTIVGDDGALVPRDAFDRELDLPCSLGDRDCVPPIQYSGLTADQACTRPVMTDWIGCAPPALFATDADLTSVFEIGGALSPRPTVYDASPLAPGEPPACRLADWQPDDSMIVRGAGAPVDLTGRLVPVHEELEDSALLRTVWAVAGEHRELREVRDRSLDVRCNATQIGPDEWRCLPVLPTVPWALFSDDACTVPIHAAFARPWDAEVGVAVEYRSDGACGQTVRAFEVLGERAPHTTFNIAGDLSCREVMRDVGGDPLHVVDLGAETTLDRFPRLTPLVE